MIRRAFTMVELALVLSLAAIVIPLIWALVLGIEEVWTLSHWHLQTADELRTVAEQLRLDARQGALGAEPAPADGPGSCRAHYEVDERGTLWRQVPEVCGGSQALATGVAGFERAEGGVSITFVRRLRPTREERSVVFVPVELP